MKQCLLQKLVNALRCNPKIHALEEVAWICLEILDNPLDLLHSINPTILNFDVSMKCKCNPSKKKEFIRRRCLFWINKNSQIRKLTDILVSVAWSDQCYREEPGSRFPNMSDLYLVSYLGYTVILCIYIVSDLRTQLLEPNLFLSQGVSVFHYLFSSSEYVSNWHFEIFFQFPGKSEDRFVDRTKKDGLIKKIVLVNFWEPNLSALFW